MTYLAVAVAIVGALSLLNLLLGLAIIARLREHSQRLGELDDLPKQPMLGNGRPVPEFTVRTTEGDELTRADLTEGSLVGFFSPGCTTCEEQVPKFVGQTRTWSTGRVIAVVMADAHEPSDELVRNLAQSAQVVREEHGGTLRTAFKLTGVPAVCRIGAGGTIAKSAVTLDELLGTGSAPETVLVRAAA